MSVTENRTNALRAEEHGHQPIVFSEWSFVMGNRMQRKDYRFDKLLAGDYEATAQEAKKRKPDQSGQLSLLDEEKPGDEGELLAQYISDYRRVQEYGEFPV